MHSRSSFRKARKQANRLKRRLAEKKISNQIKAYNNLVFAGIGIAKSWAVAQAIIPEHIKVLSALLAFVDASFLSDKPRQAKTDAIGLALRAAYLYGKFNGEPPESPGMLAQNESNREQANNGE